MARLGYPHSLKHLVPPEQHYLTRDSTAGRPEGDAAAGVVANDPKVGAKGKIAAKANYNQQGSEGHFNSALLPALSASRMQRDPLASWAGSSTFDQASDGAAFHGLSAPHSASAAGPSSHGYLCETITAQSPYEVPIVFAGAELEDDHSAAGSDADDEASDQEHELTRSTRSAKLAHNRINAEGQELESEPDTGAESDSEPEPEPESNDEPSGLSSSYESQDEDEDEDEEDTGSDTEAPAHSISAPDGLRPSSVLGGQAKATLMDRYETAWWARMEQADREEDLVEEQKVWKDWFGIEVDVKMDNYESASACALVSPDEPAGGSGSGSALDDSNGALNASAGDGQEYQSADEEMNGNESRRTSIESDDDVHDTREIAMDQDLQMADSED